MLLCVHVMTTVHCTFEFCFILKIGVTINLPLKPSLQIVIIFPAVRRSISVFLISSLKGHYHIDDFLGVNRDDLFMYFIHDAIDSTLRKKNPKFV